MYIITGAAGFIGSALVAKLNEIGSSDIILVDEIGTSISWKNLVNKQYLEYIHKTNFINQIKTGQLLSYNTNQIKAIIHMGACSTTTEENMDYLMENNVNYSCALAKFAMQNNIRFIYASSAATYGAGEAGYNDQDTDIEKYKPLNRYGYSKQLFDVWLKKNNLINKCVGLKFFNVYGPNETHKAQQASVVFHAFNQIKKTGAVSLFKSYKPEYKDGEQKRDFVYVKDCVNVIIWLLENPNVNGLFNLATGQARTWNDLAQSVFSALKQPAQINYIDMPDNIKNHYQYFTEGPITKLKKAGCPVTFHTLEQGAEDYVRNYLLPGEIY